MQLLPYEELVIHERMRSSLNPEMLARLKESILGPGGLLHAPVGWFDKKTEKWILVAGERRVRSLIALYKEGHTIFYDGKPLPNGMIPLTEVMDLTLVDRLGVELGENDAREPLSWHDTSKALARIHELQVELNPKQTFTQTAKEILASSPNNEVAGVKSQSTMRQKVREAIVVAERIAAGDKKIINAKNQTKAYNMIRREQEIEWEAELINRKAKALPVKLPYEIRNGSLFDIMPQMDDGIFDLILVDPPYGQGVGQAGFRARTSEHHNYDDSRENAKAIAGMILSEGFRVTKTRANLFIFCDIWLFDWLHENASRCGWTPWRRPLIWQKSPNEGLAPWGAYGPRYTYEMIFYATKGERGLHYSFVDILSFPRVPTRDRIYGAQKPLDLMKLLIESSTLAGEKVLDPCCGSGSSIRAAVELRRLGTGIEIDKKVADLALVNVADNKDYSKEEEDVDEAETAGSDPSDTSFPEGRAEETDSNGEDKSAG